MFGFFNVFFFFAFLLLEVSYKNPSMGTVYRAIRLNRDQFILLFVFLGCIVLIFASFAFYFVGETFWNAGIADGRGENMCVSVWQCFLTIFSLVD